MNNIKVMKYFRLVLLIVGSLIFLNSCTLSIGTSRASSSSPTDTPTKQPNSGSNVIIDKIFLENYKKSQQTIIKLLDERVKAGSDTAKISENRNNLQQELPIFQKYINSVTEAAKNTPQIDKISALKKIIVFDDITTPNKVNELQNKLGLQNENINSEEGKFGEKTKEALVKKILDFGTEVEVFVTTNPSKTGSYSSSTQSSTELAKKLEKLDRKIGDLNNWINTLSFLLSFLFLITSAVGLTIIWLWYHRNKQSPKNRINEIKDEITKINERLNSFNHDLDRNHIPLERPRQIDKYEELFDQYQNISNRVNKIEQLQLSIQQQVKGANLSQNPNSTHSGNFMPGSNAPSSYSQVTPNSIPSSHRGYGESTPRTHRQLSFINEYNQDSRNFANRYRVEEVLEEQPNIEGRRSGVVKTVNLSPAPRRRGAYWVFAQDKEYMVVPSPDAVRIQEHNQESVNAIFDYSDFNSNYSYIRLLEPAIAIKTTGGYQLTRKGRIEFV